MDFGLCQRPLKTIINMVWPQANFFCGCSKSIYYIFPRSIYKKYDCSLLLRHSVFVFVVVKIQNLFYFIKNMISYYYFTSLQIIHDKSKLICSLVENQFSFSELTIVQEISTKTEIVSSWVNIKLMRRVQATPHQRR